MRLLDAVFDVLRRAGEPLSPAEIVRQIKFARVPLDTNEPLDDESVKVELEHVPDDGSDTSGIVRTPSGRFTLPALIDRTVRTGTSIATSTASTINPISIASAVARANVGAMWTVQDSAKEVLRRARRPLSITEMTTMLRAAGVLRGTRSDDESQIRSRLIQDMLQHGRESTFVRVGNNTYGLRYFPNADGPIAAAKESEENAAKVAEIVEVETEDSTHSNRPSIVDVVTAPSRLARDISDTVKSAPSPDSDHALLRRIRTLTNQRFERFIVVFLASLGMTDVVVMNRMRPGELDIRASMSVAYVTDVHFSIQALNWHRDVHGGDIQLLRGGMRIGDHGLIITTSEFQRGALDEANRQGAIPIATINGTQLAKIAQERGSAKVLGTG